MPLRLALALALCSAPLAGAPSVTAQEDGTPRFVIEAQDGPLPPAALHKLTPGWTLQRAGGVRTLGAGEWIALQQAGRARPAPVADPLLLLGSGDRLPIKPDNRVRLQDGRMVVTLAEPLRTASGAELSLFRPYVAVLLLAVPEGVDDIESLLGKLQREPRESDLVLLRNGDRIEGTVDRLSDVDGCDVVADGAKIITPWNKLAGVAFATTGLARPRPKKTYALAVLAGGARVHFASLEFDGAHKRWSGRTTTGADLTLAESALIALDIQHGRALFLTEVPPLAYKHTPYLGVRWPLGVDTALDGRPLRVGESYFDKGLSVHGQARVTYWLDGRFTWFEAVVGLDPSVGVKARARLVLIVDGKQHVLGDGKELTAHDAPLKVRHDIRGAQMLSLVAENGSLGDVQVRVNWGGARLLRSKL
jgi:hypothetical protein